jgi:hypothetical protein
MAVRSNTVLITSSVNFYETLIIELLRDAGKNHVSSRGVATDGNPVGARPEH